MNNTLTISFLNKCADSVGFDLCGVTEVSSLPEKTQKAYNDWISQGRHSTMEYLVKHAALKADPRKVMPNCKSIIMFALNYYKETNQKNIQTAKNKVSLYAQGIDYHTIIKKKLQHFVDLFFHDTDGNAVCFVDTGPVAERFFAVKSGLGSIGKHCCIITPEFGSRVFLGVCLTDLAFEKYSIPSPDDICGSCSICVDACPTGALIGDKTLDARKCISYLTVEHKGSFDKTTPHWKNWIWGCDICQDVCPHNQHPKESTIAEFHSLPQIIDLMQGHNFDKTFNTSFSVSSIRRGGKERIPRNIQHINNK